MQSSKIRNRVLGFAIAAAAVMGMASSFARAQGYAGTVINPLTLPNGFLLANPSIDSEASAGGLTVGSAIGTQGDAMVWSGPSGAATNLNPSGFASSTANGTNGTQVVGSGSGTSTGGNSHALLWSSASPPGLDLNPTLLSGFTTSVAFATSGSQQVGDGYGTGTGSNQHALLWTGTAASAVDLNPTVLSGITSSIAYATDGSHQGGFGFGTGTSSNIHAMLWSGTAASAVDLNPTLLTGVTQSQIEGLNPSQQVGIGYGSGTGNNHHAMLWAGTAASAIDLNPTNLSGIESSAAYGTNGTVQVGLGSGSGTGGNKEAMLWSGSSTATNLQSLMPGVGTWTDSTAFTVDSNGVVYGTVDGTLYGVSGTYAVEWFPTMGWSSAVSGNWSNSGSWTPPAVPSGNVGASFNTGSATPYTVTLTGGASPQSLTVQDNVTIQKAGFNLTASGSATIAGTALQHASLTLAGGGVTTVGMLSINSFGQLDVTDNMVVVNYGVGNPSAAKAIGSYLATGYNGAAWNGVGIVSSKVASVNASKGNPHAYAVAYADASDPAVANDHFTPGTVVIEPAIVGDANLDGKVNFTDFLLLAGSFNVPGTAWDQGNFNYGPTTNFGDFLLLSANFNNSTTLDNAQFDAMKEFALSNGYAMAANADGTGFSFTAVPEPASVSVLVIGAAGLMMRRKSCRAN